MPEIRTFALKLELKYMTQKEAIIHVLEEFGGRANLTDVYPRVIKLSVFKKDSDKKATIRATIQRHPELFRQSSGKKGCWELVSFQEELAALKKENEELKEKNKLLMSIPKEAEFVEKFLQEVMNEYKRKRTEADPIRNILRHMGHEEAAAVLDAWIDEKEDELKKALEKLANMALPINIHGDYVVSKHVENEIDNVEAGGTGVNINKGED